MPHLDIAEDETRIWYALHGKASGSALDPSVPTILLLAPTSLSSEFMDYQYSDPQLQGFNLITVDERNSGKSTGPWHAAADAWVQASDLARLLLHVGAPPVWVFTTQAGSTRQGIRLAVLFPELVRGLLIGGIVIDILHTMTPQNTFFEMFNSVGIARTPEEAEPGIQRWVTYFFGDEHEQATPPEVRQRVVTYMRDNYTLAAHSGKLAHLARVIFNRTPVPRDRILSLHKPTLLLWGTENSSVPIMVAMGMQHRYKDEEGKPAKLEVIDGAPNLLSMTHPKQVNAKLADFVTKHHDAKQKPANKELERDVPYWQGKLKDFAGMIDDPELGIEHRNPKSGLSFSALTGERQRELDAIRRKWSK